MSIFHSQLSGSYYLILYITDKIQNFIEKLEDTKGVIRSRNSNAVVKREMTKLCNCV